MTEAPPIKSYSAEKFRQWLAGMTEDKDETDAAELKPLLFKFVSIVPLIYNLLDRMEMWSRISEHMVQAADSCGDDVAVFFDDLRVRLNGDVSSMISEEVSKVLDEIYELDRADQTLCLRIIRECPSELIICGRKRWKARNEK